MQYIYLHSDLGITDPLNVGKITLQGRTGISYVNKALFVPQYGWIPCSQKLCSNFTNDPKDLVLVISEVDDSDRPVTSDIWIARTGVIRTFNINDAKTSTVNDMSSLENSGSSRTAKEKFHVKTYNKMTARALVIRENSVLKFIEEPIIKKDKNGKTIYNKDGSPAHVISFSCGSKKGYVSPAAISIMKTGTIDDFQYAEISLDSKTPIPCIFRIPPQNNKL